MCQSCGHPHDADRVARNLLHMSGAPLPLARPATGYADHMTTTPPLMLLDAAAMYFRAFHALPDSIRAPDGTPVNAVRGMLDMVARLATDLEPSGIVACWDEDWRPQWRVDLIPSYKAHRVAEASDAAGIPDTEEVPDLLSPQVEILAELLPLLGIPIVGAAEHEADDVIGTLAATADGPVDVVTSDRDLFQVVDDERRVRVVYTGRGMSKLDYVTDGWLRDTYGIGADQYAEFAVLRGDPSDGLPGVPGVGEKTAVDLLQQYDDLLGIVRAAADLTSSMRPPHRRKIVAAADYLLRAPAVVNVVRDLKLPTFDAGRGVGDADRAEFERLAEHWGLGDSAKRALKALG
ncbi:MAG: flap endonuclease [Thermoleophilia bacterium]|nr:flap endonuclease [Thermoleophilia bacterium]